MRHFKTQVDIAAPAPRVYDVMCDVERWHEWTASVRSVRLLGDGTFAVGARAVVRQPGFPPALWEVTALEAGHGFAWVSRAPGLTVIGRHCVLATDGGGSRATLMLDIEGMFGGVWGRLTRGITERYIGFEAAGLKARSENPDYRLALGAS